MRDANVALWYTSLVCGGTSLAGPAVNVGVDIVPLTYQLTVPQAITSTTLQAVIQEGAAGTSTTWQTLGTFPLIDNSTAACTYIVPTQYVTVMSNQPWRRVLFSQISGVCAASANFGIPNVDVVAAGRDANY
jgi:hypothetical protein